MNLNYFTFPLITYLLLICSASGQQKQETRSCRILFLNRPTTAPATLHLFDGKDSHEVDLPGMNLSKVYHLPLGKLALSLLPTPLSDPELLPAGAPTAVVPENFTDIYLLVMSDPANKVAPVRLQVADASRSKIQNGQTLWFNLTLHTIGGKLGDEKIVLKPKSSAVMDAPRNDQGEYPVKLAYQMQGKEHTYPICQTRWIHDPRVRSIAFVINRKNTRTPRVFLHADFRSEKPEKRD
jgi:hypothetical protein